MHSATSCACGLIRNEFCCGDNDIQREALRRCSSVMGVVRTGEALPSPTLLLRGRLNNLFDALHWQVNRTASLLIAEYRLIVR